MDSYYTLTTADIIDLEKIASIGPIQRKWPEFAYGMLMYFTITFEGVPADKIYSQLIKDSERHKEKEFQIGYDDFIHHYKLYKKMKEK